MIIFGIEKAEEFRVQVVVDLHEQRPSLVLVLNGLLKTRQRMKRFLLLLNG